MCYKLANPNKEFSSLIPAGLLKLRCLSIFTVLPVLLVMSTDVMAQTGGVHLTGRVSETVALSVLPNVSSENAEVMKNGNTVRIVLSGNDSKEFVYRVPLLVRSNSGFKISGEVESATAELDELSVIDVRTTGTLASPLALSNLNVRALNENTAVNSQPSLVLTGPRVSHGGTLDSPNNALQITVLIRVTPNQAQGWQLHLKFAATAESLTQ